MLHRVYWHRSHNELPLTRRIVKWRADRFTVYSYLGGDGRVVATGWFIWRKDVTQVTKTT